MSQYITYTEYLSFLLLRWPEFQWLHSFLLNPAATPADCYTTFLYITDERVQAHTFSSSSPSFRDCLQQRVSGLKNKIVVVHYVDIEHVDRRMLCETGLHYDAKPVFYWHHFDTAMARTSNDDRRKTSLLPTKCISLELGYLAYEHASILFLPDAVSSDGILTSKPAMTYLPRRRYTGTDLATSVDLVAEPQAMPVEQLRI